MSIVLLKTMAVLNRHDGIHPLNMNSLTQITAVLYRNARHCQATHNY